MSSSVENLFSEPAADAPQYQFIESFGLYLTRDGQTFSTKEELDTYLNSAAIRSWVEAYLAHVDAHPEKYFTKSAKKARTKRDGTVVPAKEAGIVDEKVQVILKGRIRSIAADVVTFMLNNSGS